MNLFEDGIAGGDPPKGTGLLAVVLGAHSDLGEQIAHAGEQG